MGRLIIDPWHHQGFPQNWTESPSVVDVNIDRRPVVQFNSFGAHQVQDFYSPDRAKFRHPCQPSEPFPYPASEVRRIVAQVDMQLLQKDAIPQLSEGGNSTDAREDEAKLPQVTTSTVDGDQKGV